MKKVILAMVMVGLLAGCMEKPQIKFEGETRHMDEVGEILGDRLEAENPGLDIDVDVYEEVED